MSSMTAGLIPAEAQARPSQTASRASSFTPAVVRSELSRGPSTGEEAEALRTLQLAQYQERGGGSRQQVRPTPVPPNNGNRQQSNGSRIQNNGQVGTTGTGFGAIITFGGGQTSVTVGPVLQPGQVATYKTVITNGSERYWVRVGEVIPYGYYRTDSNLWDHLFTGYAYTNNTTR